MIKRSAALIAVITLLASGMVLTATPEAAELLVGRVHSSFQPTDGKVFVLVIGNDARSGNPLNSRSDAIHIVGINTETMRGGILNFPRDSWVPIPGYGTSKINEALYHGGPDLLAQTLENMTGIRLDYWVMVGFEDFRNIIKGLGGVKVHLPTAVYDPSGSGARLPAGTHTLGGHQSLAYVRTRHSFGGGDITRTTNQAGFLLALLKKLRGEMQKSPAALLRWISITQRYARYDMSADEMLRLGVVASEMKPRNMGNVTVPVSIGTVGAASVVFITSSASSVYARFRETGEL
ncbi:MAG: polyisoprenyl-teichoic acid--peptidoglycan teichoic acid transferase [Actinomycetota bacterium]|jgi:LCP family protein required for cell wall assembly|nr:polyisoprenyl-teichoic acid--peptidoglycan teichoic acid transferase [Actinomycetota bacterium]